MALLLYDKLVELLKVHGVIEVFGIPGNAINPDELTFPLSITFSEATGFGLAKIKELFNA